MFFTVIPQRARSDFKGRHEPDPHPFLSLENILLSSIEVCICWKHILQYESESSMKLGKEPHGAHKLQVGYSFISILVERKAYVNKDRREYE